MLSVSFNVATRRRVLCSALAAVTLLYGSSAGAQNAQLSGFVRDQQGAGVPSAAVVATNVATNVSRATQTDRRGAYLLVSLPPATYRLEANAPGFSLAKTDDVVLEVNQDARVDLVLAAAGVAESIVVQGDAYTVGTRQAAIGLVIDRRFAENVPLPGNTFQSLIELAPGVVHVPSQNSGSGFSINGQRRDSNYVTVDGVSANVNVSLSQNMTGAAAGQGPATTMTGGYNGLVSVDALQELRVQTSAFAPEYGRTPGGLIAMVTRSGSNAFKGSVSGSYRPKTLQANNWYTNYNGAKPAAFREHIISGTAGGPLSRDHVFFFASHETLDVNQPNVTRLSVPSIEAREGAVAAAKPLFDAMPSPTGAALSGGTAPYLLSYDYPTKQYSSSARVDLSLSPRYSGFFRYSYAPSNQKSATTVSTTTNERTFWTATAGATAIISSQTVADVRVNVSHATGLSDERSRAVDGAVAPPDSFWPSEAGGIKYIMYAFNSVGVNLTRGAQILNTQEQYNAVATLSHVRGKHQLKAGLDVRMLAPRRTSVDPSAIVIFNTVSEALAGVAPFVSITRSSPANANYYNFSLYAQDTWRVSSRLSATYGVRWDVNPAPSFTGDKPLTAINADDPQRLDLVESDGALWSTRYAGVAPRLGLVWEIDKDARTTLTAGSGLFYDMGTQNTGALFAGGLFPFSNNYLAFQVPIPLRELPAGPVSALDWRTPPYKGSITLADPNMATPLTTQWNVKLERALDRNSAASLAYSGNIGRNLLTSEQYLHPNERFPGTVTLLTATARSRYHALMAQYRRRALTSVNLVASYTLSKAADNATNASENLSGQLPDSNWGPSDIDVRHLFTAALSWEVPGPAGRWALPLRDWGVDAMVRARSAFPLNITTGRDLGLGFFNQERPNLVAGQPIWIKDPTVPSGQRLDPAAFELPVPGTQGNLGRNAIRALPAKQVDLALRRQFRFGRIDAQLRIDAYNVFNWPQHGVFVTRMASAPFFGISVGSLNSGGGGQLGMTALSPQFQSGGPRACDVSVRVRF